MIYGSVCSGIEAATVAWHPLGWRAAFYSEIEPFPCAVLAHHYPDTPNHGDMTRFGEWPDATCDVLVGGTPCQSFSVAGLRQGLRDPRGNLMLTYGAIAARYRPRWLVWENVPGVLSSWNGRDFAAFLGMLAELGYGFAYRILDARYFGVPQRRRRVFVVGHSGNWRRAAAVLFECQSLRGDPAPRREKGQAIAGTLSARASGRSGGLGTDFECDGGLVPDVSLCLNAGGMGRQDWETETMIAHPLRGQHNASLRADSDTYVVPFDSTQITHPENRSNPKPGDPSPTLSKGAHAPAIAFTSKDHGQDAVDDVAPTVRAMGGERPNGGGQLAVAFKASHYTRGKDGAPADVAAPLSADADKGDQDQLVFTSNVRRLTPRECERLQGFPDDYTAVPFRGSIAKDGPRYKSLGNSMAVPVMRWLGERIAMVDSL